MSKYADLFLPNTGDDPAAGSGVVDLGAETEVPEGFRLLFVDDEPSVLKALKRIFLDEDYEILTAGSVSEALTLLAQNPVHLIISDHRMPGRTGTEFLKEVKQRWPETIRIMLTGHADVQSIMGAVNEGAVYKFITKPWNDEDLRLTVSLALQQYTLIRENRKLKEITRKQQSRIKSYSSRLMENKGFLDKLLVKAGLVSEADLTRARQEREDDEHLIDTLARLGCASESKIIRALQEQLRLEYIDLKEVQCPTEVIRFLPRNLCEKSRILPIRLDNRQLTLAMADPSDLSKCDNIALMTGLKVEAVIARSQDILDKLRAAYDEEVQGPGTLDDLAEVEPIDEIDIVLEDEEGTVNVQELISSSEVPPIIRIVNAVLAEAIRYRASDIHIEPKTKYTSVRFRIDGMLYDKIRVPADIHPALISRIKILAKLDISERRQPQDGRITVKSGTRMVDLRVSTMPSINGEKVVMRILDKSASVKPLGDLGLLGQDLKRLRSLIRKPQGIFISTGPTGSGKTTMLYSILGEMIDKTRNFETIEDPVEYFVEEANQVYVRDRVGLSFASVLRATLRQDPDVILVGEIRDFETADVAFKAALTGHMVLTSLHTNNTIASVTRLIDLGVPPYLISSALEGIIAQRLVRRICRHCREEVPPDEGAMDLLKIQRRDLGDRIYRGKGCPRCNKTGYQGRLGLYELFVMNDDFRHLIAHNYKESELFKLARVTGAKTLMEDGLEKVKLGETTLEELLRVIGPQIRHERSCERCQKTIDAKFLFCPYCGIFKQDICPHCHTQLENDWLVCANCGEKRPDKLAAE